MTTIDDTISHPYRDTTEFLVCKCIDSSRSTMITIRRHDAGLCKVWKNDDGMVGLPYWHLEGPSLAFVGLAGCVLIPASKSRDVKMDRSDYSSPFQREANRVQGRGAK